MNGTTPLGFYHSTNRSVSWASGGFYPPLQLVGAKRFLNGNEPGWFGNQRMGTDPVRHENIGENLWKNVYPPAGSGG